MRNDARGKGAAGLGLAKRPVVLLMLACLAVCSATAQEDLRNMEVRGFRVPEYDSEGNMTSQLFGDRAEMQGGGEVKITGMKVEFYRDGQTVMTVSSPYCFFNQNTRTARSDAPVAADMERVKIRGRGFDLDSENNTVTILNDSHVTLIGMQAPGVDVTEAPVADTNLTVITSQILILDYKTRTARFKENVHVVDPKMEMFCEELEIHFDDEDEISWIGASRGVRILHEGREATAGRALFDMSTEEVVLQDNPRIRDGRQLLTGDQIRFWRTTERMVCEPSARMIVYSDGQFSTGIFER